MIGEDSFKELAQESELKESSVFVQSESRLYVINPDHYKSLLRIIGPLLSSNKKGFIVTATIAEAERLKDFLNKEDIGITFEAYHSQMGDSERREVLERSRSFESPHYIIAVRALDEGVDLPHLSAYIDINLNVSILQMIHRIGRVLRVFPGKQMADILFLTDYKNEQFAKDVLIILEKLEVLSFSGVNNDKSRKGSGDRNLRFKEAGITLMKREDLLEMRNRTSEFARKFWTERYTLEEVPEAIAKLNETSPATEQITSVRTYKEFHPKDSKLPPWETLVTWYLKKHSRAKGLLDFILSRTKVEFYSLEEIPSIFLRLLHENSLKTEQITNVQRTYEELRPKDPKLPSWNTLLIWYEKSTGLSDYILNRTKIEPYTLEEIPSAVSKLNKISLQTEQITSVRTYKEFHPKDPKLPSWNTLAGWYEKKHKNTKGLLDFILSRTKMALYTLEEIPLAFLKLLHENSLQAEQIINVRKTYEELHPKNPRFPHWSTARNWYKHKHGNSAEFLDFILNRTKMALYTLEEIPSVFLRLLHENSLKTEQITNVQRTYEELRHQDSRLPSWNTLARWYKNKYRNTKGLRDFVFGKKQTN